MRRERRLAAGAPEPCGENLDALIRTQIEGKRRRIASREALAHGGGERIGGTALKPASRHDEIAARGLVAMEDLQRLQRLALEGFEEMRTPGEMQRAIRRRERRKRDPRLPEGARPAAIRSEPRPGGAAEREDSCVRRELKRRAKGVAELQAAALSEADEGMTRLEDDALIGEPCEQRAQQRRGLETLGKDPAARADEGLLPEPGAEIAQILR